MSNTLEFLQFPPLDLISKFRLGATIFYASRVKDWKAVGENFGRRLADANFRVKKHLKKMWKPLLKAKLGEAYKETSAAFIWSTIQRMYAARNSGLKKEMFGYVRGGYARVLERFGEHLREKGVEIRLNSRVEKIEKVDRKIEIFPAKAQRREEEIYPQINTDGHRLKIGKESVAVSEPSAVADGLRLNTQNIIENYDSVILTCPSNIAANIVPQLTDAEKQN